MLQPTIGHINPESPRAVHWQRVYGCLEVPLRSPLPERAYGPDGTIQIFYKVDVDKLTREQIDRLAKDISERFSIPTEEVYKDIQGEHGVPILADDVSVSFDARYVL